MSGPTGTLAPLLHIGYTKAGSTWLQRFLFENAGAGFALVDRRASVNALILPHTLDFVAGTARQQLRPLLEEATGAGLVPALSAERLSGSPHSGGYDTTCLADRLREVYPEGRVLIVIREQRAMIASTYKQYVRVGGTCRPLQYLDPPRDPRVPLFSFDYFAYHQLIDYYHQVFGKDAVLVRPFEQFVRAGDQFVADICEFAGVPPVKGLPYDVTLKGAATPFMRRTTRWRNMVSEPTSINVRTWPIPVVRRSIAATSWIDPFVPAKVQVRIEHNLKRTIAGLVGDRYRESNRITAELTGMDLGAYGYDV